MTQLIPALLILLILVFLGAPIFSAILASGIYITVFVNNMPLNSIFTTMFEGISKNNLLAIPYFILAGNFISGGTLGRRLMDALSVFLRNIRGGMPLACLAANAIFGAISGSPPAATAVFAKIVHEPLAESDGDKLATGLVVSASGLSAIIPPSIAMIVFGIATDTSISKLFVAGILPGILIVSMLGIYLVVVCKRNTYDKFTWKEAGHALKSGFPVLILPVIVLGGIYGGILTPTEAGALAAVYCFLISFFVLRDIDLKKTLSIIKESAIVTSKTFILIAACSVLARALTVAQFPQMLVAALEGFSSIQLLLMLNVLLLIVGCFFDTAPAILILAPLFAPVATALGIDPLHLGIIFVVNLTIGMFTPPFGLNIFIAQSVLKKDVLYITKSILPFLLIYLAALLILTFFPAISTWLPSIM